MDMFDLGAFNNREKALFMWLALFLVVVCLNKEGRKHIRQIARAFFVKDILIPVLSMTLYVVFMLWGLYRIGIWDISFLKDSVFWYLGTAFVLMLHMPEATVEKGYFQSIVLDNLKLVIVLEFILDFYTFGLLVEVMLFPVLVFLGVLGSIAGRNPEHSSVKKLVDLLSAGFGFYVLVRALSFLFQAYDDFATLENLQGFSLPIILTFMYLPFYYAIVLWATYEEIFVRVDTLLKRDKRLARFVKLQVLISCHINLRRVKSFYVNFTKRLLRLQSRNDVREMMDDFRRDLARSS